MTQSTALSGRVTVARNDPADAGVRQVIARIDDGPRTTLMFGESMSQELPPGGYRLRLHNTLVWKTVPFTVGPGEHARITVINRAGRLSFGFLAMLGAAPMFLTVRIETGAPSV